MSEMSEPGANEQAVKGNFLKRIIKGLPGKPTLPDSDIGSDFESQLFQNGTLDFDFDQYTAEAREYLERKKQWYQNADWDTEITTKTLARELDDAKYEMIWRRRFSGQIPKHWYIWYNISGDFEKAKAVGAKLSETLVDAGITHPHHLVANEVGKGQRLNTRQLAWLFVRPNFKNWNREEILTAQRHMGVSEKDLREAMRMADKIRNEVKKKSTGSYTLDDASSHFQAISLPDKGGK